MSGYPLKAVLDLRRREEEAAMARLANATRALAVAEMEQSHKIEKVAMARDCLRAAWQAPGDDGMHAGAGTGNRSADVTGADEAARARFVARRRAELTQAEANLAAFQTGPLSEARAAERVARKEHLIAHQAREAFDKHEAQFRAKQRRAGDLREEETLEDVARTASHGRGDREK